MSSERIPAGKALKNWKALLDRAAAGERIVITREGKDVATLGPVEQRDITVRLAPGPSKWAGAKYDTPATHELLSRIAGKPLSGQSIVLSTKLIVRESA